MLSSTSAIEREISSFLVQEQILSSVQSSISFTGLDGLADGGYTLELGLILPSAMNAAIGLCINGDTTSGNYVLQEIYGATSTVASYTTDQPKNVININNIVNGTSSSKVDIQIFNGQVIFTSIMRFKYGTDEFIELIGSRYSTLVTNINSLVIQGYTNGASTTLANCFGVGTTARLYSKKKQYPMNYSSPTSLLLAEILVGANTTSVTFSGLDILQHYGYWLESQFVGTSQANNMYLYINGDTNNANYKGQQFWGQSSSGAAGQPNFPSVGYTYVNSSDYTVANIQLISGHGLVSLQDFAGVQTANPYIAQTGIYHNTTISNITSLTIQSQNANGIATGSRFRLYRRR